MSLGDFGGARKIDPAALGALALSKTILTLVSDGSAEGVIQAPSGIDYTSLILQADVGNWRIRTGDYRSRVLVAGIDSTDVVEITDHGHVQGDGPFRITTEAAAVIPTGLAVDTDYWIATVIDDDHVVLAASLANATAAPVVPVNISADSGANVMAFAGSADGGLAGTGWANTVNPAAAQVGVVGYGATKLGVGATLIVSASDIVTARAYNSGDVLTAWFI